jgi:hypothetical protein
VGGGGGEFFFGSWGGGREGGAARTRFRPSDRLRSQRNMSKPSFCRDSDTSDTCEESIACSTMPVAEHSRFVSVTRSLMLSICGRAGVGGEGD